MGVTFSLGKRQMFNSIKFDILRDHVFTEFDYENPN